MTENYKDNLLQKIAKEKNNKVFLYRWATMLSSKYILIDEHYYLLKDCLLWEIHDGNLRPEPLHSNIYKSIEIGDYDSNLSYPQATYTFDLEEIIKLRKESKNE